MHNCSRRLRSTIRLRDHSSFSVATRGRRLESSLATRKFDCATTLPPKAAPPIAALGDHQNNWRLTVAEKARMFGSSSQG
jgi:hypothetical protein